MTTAIKFDHVNKTFADSLVVNNLNLEIKQGELFVLVGNSGSGKTTSIKMINRLEDPSSGQVLINGRPTNEYNLQKLRWDIGYVLQEIALFPNMTVGKNVGLIPEIKGEKKDKAQQKMIEKRLYEVGLDPKTYYNRYPSELSGGEQQRIGILRAIISNPPVVLMDEPFSALDPLSRTNLQNLVIDLHQKMQNTIVFVTHDMNEALKMADRIGVMKDGNLLQVDKPQEVLHHPANQFVQEFFRGSLGSDLYETTLHEARLFNQLNETKKQLQAIKTISEETKFAQVLQLLSDEEELAITDKNENLLGYLDRQWVIKYLAKANGPN